MRVTIDLMKKSTQIIDLSNVINPRVGDDDLLLPLHIIYGDNQTDMRGKDVEFLSNDPNKKNIYIAGTCNTNTPGDNLYMGDLTFRFPAGTFKADGTYDPDKTMFRIVDKETQKVISSVNVKITVMKSNIEFDFDPDNSSYDSRLETMLHDFHDKGQTMLDEIKDLNNQAKSNVSGDTATTANAAKKQADQNAGDISDLKGEVAGARGRFADLPGREDAQDTAINQRETIVNANANYAALKQKDAQQDVILANKAGKFELEAKLAQMHIQPEGFENEAALKAKYPNGKAGIMVTVDTGHKWLWINGAWVDCGIYQAAADAKVLSPVMEQVYRNAQSIAQNSNSASLLTDYVNMINAELNSNKADIEANRNAIKPIQAAGRLETTYLTDEAGGYLTDGHGEKVAFSTWRPNVDRIKRELGVKPEAYSDAYQLPILYLYGSKIPSLVNKTNSLGPDDGISYSFPMFRVSGNLKKIKVQGASSAGLAKKNYTLVFDREFQAFRSYGAQDKYVIKANMTDASQIRNVSAANLWGAVRGTNVNVNDALKVSDADYLTDNDGNHILCESNPQLSLGGNYGAISGFPCAVYINDQYWGLYSFCIAKDKGMAKMPKRDGYGIVSTVAADFKTPVKLDDTDMSVEYSGTKSTAWMAVSINKLVDVIKADYASKADFVKAVAPYLDLGSAIDYYAYTVALDNNDGIYRNFCLQTWNGQTWFVAAYDLDLIMGRSPDIDGYLSPVYKGADTRKGGITFENLAGTTKLFEQLWKFCKHEILNRYGELVKGPLSTAAVGTLFTNYGRLIPRDLRDEETKIWPETPNTDVDNIEQIRWWYREHTDFLKELLSDATTQTVNN